MINSSEPTARKMYNIFKTLHQNTCIKYEYYNKIFKENFDLKFGRPQIDMCYAWEELTIKLKN